MTQPTRMWKLTVENLSRPDLAEASAWHKAQEWEGHSGFTYSLTEDSGTVTVTSPNPLFLADLMPEFANGRTFDRVTLEPSPADTASTEG